MLRETITYVDFDGETKTETFWFNMTEAEIAKALLSEDGGVERRWQAALKSGDKGRFVMMFDDLVRMSIGKRPEGTLGFRKTSDYADEFLASEAYSKMWKTMFADVNKAVAFFIGIFPKDMLEQAKKDLVDKQGQPGVPIVDQETLSLFDLADKKDAVAANIDTDAKINEQLAPKPGHEYTIAELQSMTDAEFVEWEKRTPARVMRDDQMKYAYTRRMKA